LKLLRGSKLLRQALVILLLLLLLVAHPVQAGMADRVGATFGLMTVDFAHAFQAIEHSRRRRFWSGDETGRGDFDHDLNWKLRHFDILKRVALPD